MASQNGDAYDGATAVGDTPNVAQNNSAPPLHPVGAGGRQGGAILPQGYHYSSGSSKKKGSENVFNQDAGVTLNAVKATGARGYSTMSGGSGDHPMHEHSTAEELPFVDSSAYLDTKRPFLVRIKDNVRNALLELNEELIREGRTPLISKKKPGQLLGREVYSGAFGL